MLRFTAFAFGLLATAVPAAGIADRPAGAQPQIWLKPQGGLPPAPQPLALDYLDMFRPDAPWKDAAARVNVFVVTGVLVDRASPEQLAMIVGDLKRRGIALALETGAIDLRGNPPPPCGGSGRVEGYSFVGAAKLQAQRIKAAGGTLNYVAMDEPLYYGHYFDSAPNAAGVGCHTPIADLAASVARVVGVFRSEFPGVQVGDTEPTGFIEQQPDWQSAFAQWAADFRANVGVPLAFTQLDVQWPLPNGRLSNGIRDGVTVYRALEQLAARGEIGKVGIIYNGSREDPSDLTWVRNAQSHVLAMEENNGLRPDQACFYSWTKSPTHAMPDNGADTLTSLVTFYFSPSVMQVTGRSPR